jgi:hypothetical protein
MAFTFILVIAPQTFLPVAEDQLRIDGPEVTRRTHQDAICAQGEKGGGTLRLVWHDDRQLAASRLGRPDETDRCLAIATWRGE